MPKSFVERLFPRAIERITNEKAASMMVAEAADQEWAFQKIGSGSDDFPEAFTQHVILQSKRAYESHGLGWRIVERQLSIMYGGGYRYDLKFAPGFPEEYQAAIREAIEEFWNDENVDILDRTRELMLQVLISGEHGISLGVDSLGRVRVGEISRDDVVTLGVDSEDTRRLVSVTARTGEGAEERRYAVVHRDREHKHLVGECMYLRLGSRAKKTRGTPFLQRVVDELAAEKKFRVLSGDRVLDRLSVSMLTTIAGMNTAELDAYRKKVGTKLPSSRRVFQNEQIKNEFISANMEAGDVSTLIRTWITVIAGMFGWPISWFGFGDGSTRATAEAQQDPAVTDSNQMKTMFERFVERLLYFVVDQAILANRIDAVNTPNAGLTVTVKDGAKDGLVRARSIRDCVTINVSTIPLVESQPTTTPLAATATAADVVGKLLAMKGETGEETVSIDDVLAILNFAFATDGVGIELARDLVTE